MRKLKVKKSAAKRFKVSGKGKLLRKKAGKSHLLGDKPRKRKRSLSKTTELIGSKLKTIKRLIGGI